MRIVLFVFLVLTFAVSTAVSVQAKVGSISFEDLASSSEQIVIGKVETVTSIEDVRVAKVAVTRTLKGTPVNELYYLAEPTWTCDITSAEVGETALFFFYKYGFTANPKSRETLPDGQILLKTDYEEPLGFRAQIESLTKGNSFWMVAHSGRGRMPLRTINGVDYVTLWTEDVILPKRIKTVEGPEAEYDFIRSVAFDGIVSLTEKSLVSKRKKETR